jgi:hypothetical protein
MRFAIIITSLLGLAAATGCAGRNAHANGPDSNDPAWTPPGEMMVTMHSAPTSTTGTDASNTALGCPQPNKTEIKGKQIRAAADMKPIDRKAFLCVPPMAADSPKGQ